jgi:Uma2 family endonuclease
MTRPHSAKLTLSQKDHGLELTHEEFAEADFQEPWRYERVNRRLVVMTPAGDGHQSTTEPFRSHLGAYALSHPDIVDHVYQDSWVVIDEDTERFPDIAVYLRSDEVPALIPQRVPELIFEIVSPSAADRRRDYEDKRIEYQRIAVKEYVIVDRFVPRVLVLTLENGEYAERELGPNDNDTTPLLPGLEIPLAKILE